MDATIRRPRLVVMLSRGVAATPFFVTSALFLAQIVLFVRSGHDVTPRLRSMADWPVFELLASTFGILLPLTGAVARFWRRHGLPGADRPRLQLGVRLALLLPFFVAAWNTCGSALSSKVWLLLYLVFTAVHWFAFACDEARRTRLVATTRTDEPATGPLARSALSFVMCYAAAMVACGLALFFVFAPMDIYGSFIESDARHIYMSVSVGAFFFLLLGVGELVDFQGWLLGRGRRRLDEARLDRGWRRDGTEAPAVEPRPAAARRHPTVGSDGAEVPIVALDLGRSQAWIDALPVRAATRDRLQYADDGLVRFGEPYRKKRTARRVCGIGAGLAFALAFLCGWIAADERAFEKKYARDRHLSPYSTTGPTEESDRAAFRAMCGFFLLLSGGLGVGAWRLRRETLGRARVVLDLVRGRLVGPDDLELPLSDGALVVRHDRAAGPRPPLAGETRSLAFATPGREVVLAAGVAPRDAEALLRALEPARA